MLTKGQIQYQKLILNGSAPNYNESGYAVTIDEIVDSQQNIHEAFEIPPRGIVFVCSKEIVSLPNNITGHAFIKTSLSSEGVLATNIGLIDPMYKGYLKSLLFNFGKKAYRIEKGHQFLRLTFFEHEPTSATLIDKSDKQKYLLDLKLAMRNYLGKEFLSVDTYVKKAERQATKRVTSAIWIVLPIVLTVFSLIYIFAEDLGDKFFHLKSEQEVQILQLNQQVDFLENQIRKLEQSILDLKRTQSVNINNELSGKSK